MKTLTLNSWGTDHPITFRLARYVFNDNLYVGMITHYEGYPEPYGDLTVNLNAKCAEDCAFIDTNNNGAHIIEWLITNKLATLTGRVKMSGFCGYREVRFNMDELIKYVTSDERK